jgi:hypothetical protein
VGICILKLNKPTVGLNLGVANIHMLTPDLMGIFEVGVMT